MGRELRVERHSLLKTITSYSEHLHEYEKTKVVWAPPLRFTLLVSFIVLSYDTLILSFNKTVLFISFFPAAVGMQAYIFSVCSHREDPSNIFLSWSRYLRPDISTKRTCWLGILIIVSWAGQPTSIVLSLQNCSQKVCDSTTIHKQTCSQSVRSSWSPAFESTACSFFLHKRNNCPFLTWSYALPPTS